MQVRHTGVAAGRGVQGRRWMCIAAWGLLTWGVLMGVCVPPAFAADPVKPIVYAYPTDYDPAEITVHVGDTVRWENATPVLHELAFDGNPTGSAEPLHRFLRRKPVEITMRRPGIYPYRCRWHGMVARVVVRPRPDG